MGEIKKEELEKLTGLDGKVRGAVFQTDARYVLEKEGEEGLKKLEKKTKELGYKIDYRNGKATDWHPVVLRIISLLLVKSVFDWTDKEIREMGKTAPKFSCIVKFIFKIFAPTKKLVKEIPSYWKEHYATGDLVVVRFDEKNREMFIDLKNFKSHPVLCSYLEGYFERVLMFVERGVKVEERKCVFKGDSCHEYFFTWE